MAKRLHVTIADEVYSTILILMDRHRKTNRSEFVEELIRKGLQAKEVEA